MDRREFMTGVAAAGVTMGLLSKLSAAALPSVRRTDKEPDLVAVAGGMPAAMFERGIAEFGGMKSFVKPGQRVLVKPNIAWAQPPEMAANTNPELVGAIVKSCLNAGAKEVVVFDKTCNEWRSCYRKSGIADAVRAAGGKVLSGSDKRDYRDVDIPNGKRMKLARVNRHLLDSDVVIDVPVLKHHGGAQLTAAMKNYMGVVWDRGFMHKNDLHQCIADLVSVRKPDLVVIDAYRVLVNHGPRGQSPNDVRYLGAQILSRDIVAADTAATLMLKQLLEREEPARAADFAPDQIRHLAYGEALGLGSTRLEKLAIKRIKL